MTPKYEDRWINTTVHSWDGKLVRPDWSTTLRRTDPNVWFIQVHWRLVAGAAMPVGIEFRSNRTSYRKGTAAWDDGNGLPKRVSREMFKRLPIGEILDQGREQCGDIWEAVRQRTRSPETQAIAEAIRRRPGRRSTAVERYRITGEMYEIAVNSHDVNRMQIAKRVTELVNACGREMSDDRMATASDALVRKWIVRARDLGYIDHLVGHDHRGGGQG